MTEKDHSWLNPDDTIDGFVYLLKFTPAVNNSVAKWTEKLIRGQRTAAQKTRLVTRATLNNHLCYHRRADLLIIYRILLCSWLC